MRLTGGAIMKFSENLRRYREQAGFKSAKEFADLLGIQYSTYVNYENSDREPRFDIVSKIAKALNISIDQLMGFEKPEDKIQRYRQKLQNLGFSVLIPEDINSDHNVLIENRDGWASALPSQDFIELMKNIESSKGLTDIEYAVYNNAFEEYKNEKYKNEGAELIKKIAANNSEEAKAFRQTAQKLFPELFKKIMKSQENNKE